MIKTAERKLQILVSLDRHEKIIHLMKQDLFAI